MSRTNDPRPNGRLRCRGGIRQARAQAEGVVPGRGARSQRTHGGGAQCVVPGDERRSAANLRGRVMWVLRVIFVEVGRCIRNIQYAFNRRGKCGMSYCNNIAVAVHFDKDGELPVCEEHCEYFPELSNIWSK